MSPFCHHSAAAGPPRHSQGAISCVESETRLRRAQPKQFGAQGGLKAGFNRRPSSLNYIEIDLPPGAEIDVPSSARWQPSSARWQPSTAILACLYNIAPRELPLSGTLYVIRFKPHHEIADPQRWRGEGAARARAACRTRARSPSGTYQMPVESSRSCVGLRAAARACSPRAPARRRPPLTARAAPALAPHSPCHFLRCSAWPALATLALMLPAAAAYVSDVVGGGTENGPPLLGGAPPVPGCTAYWYTQKLDHFDRHERRTWQQVRRARRRAATPLPLLVPACACTAVPRATPAGPAALHRL